MAENNQNQNPMRTEKATREPGSPRAGDFFNLLIGLWLLLSPVIYASSYSSAEKTNTMYSGIILLILAVVGLIAVRETWSRWLEGLLGIWLLVSPFVLGLTSNAMALWSNIVLGILVIIFSMWSAGAATTRRRVSPQY